MAGARKASKAPRSSASSRVRKSAASAGSAVSGGAKPKAPIRRFDVFAEYNRLKAIAEEGLSDRVAKGHGLWMAKIVAARKFSRAAGGAAPVEHGLEKKTRGPGPNEWHVLSDEPQTDELFDKQIVDRMGRAFYRRVFAPAIRAAYERGESYVAIRDVIRGAWRP
ncbi:MAG: hypothetical protein ACREOU_05730 [Candidatus Eiseniibacteriota bacterium]